MNGSVYTMKITKSPEGKIYTIERQTAKTYKLLIPDMYLWHMVLVIGRVPYQPGWVRIVTITSTVDPNVDWSHYLPIYPSKKNQRNGIQLHLRSSLEQWIELYRRSYARVDSECSVPVQILKRTPEEGLQFELQSKSRQAVLYYLNRRPMQSALGQSRPIVQPLAETDEAEEESGPSSDSPD